MVQGRPDESAMIKAIRHDAAIKMPPRSKLPAQAITDLTTWVQIGAPWPDNTVEHSAGGAGGPATTIRRQRNDSLGVSENGGKIAHLSSRILPGPELPSTVLSWRTLEGHGLSPSPRADKRTLIRRARRSI